MPRYENLLQTMRILWLLLDTKNEYKEGRSVRCVCRESWWIRPEAAGGLFRSLCFGVAIHVSQPLL